MKTKYLTLILLLLAGCKSPTKPCEVVRTPTAGAIPAQSNFVTRSKEVLGYPECPADRRLEFLSNREIVHGCGSKCDFGNLDYDSDVREAYDYKNALCVPDHLQQKAAVKP